MAVNETLTVEQFDERYTFIDLNTEEQMRAGKVKYFDCTAGASGDGWVYVNLMLYSEANEKLNDLAFMEDGELVVSYQDMRDNFTPAAASSAIGTEIPQTFMGESIRVGARIGTDDEGNSYINVVKIRVLEEDGGTVDFNPDAVEKQQKVEQ